MVSEKCVECNRYDGNLFCGYYEVDISSVSICENYVPNAENIPITKWSDHGDVGEILLSEIAKYRNT